MLTRLANWFFSWFEAIPGEDGAEWKISETHDPEKPTRMQYDDDFPALERKTKSTFHHQV